MYQQYRMQPGRADRQLPPINGTAAWVSLPYLLDGGTDGQLTDLRHIGMQHSMRAARQSLSTEAALVSRWHPAAQTA